jgi:alpha-1,3-mannosylglycoprotein beta-1,4-N-acetylglucosaminyltransferase A/B
VAHDIVVNFTILSPTRVGIPTVKRDKQSYLLSTLDNLLVNMDEEEQNDTMIVVFIGETDLEYVHQIAREIQLRFAEYLDSGLIEVISPPASYYPNMDKLRITLNDPIERVKWRSKQNLDFAFLMAYSQVKATFYVQLEDDILAKRGYIKIMKQFAVAKTAKQEQDPWFVLDFCQLGFIGESTRKASYKHLQNTPDTSRSTLLTS